MCALVAVLVAGSGAVRLPTAAAATAPVPYTSSLLPPQSLGTVVELKAVSCFAPGSCVAVGYYSPETSYGPAFDAQPLIETLSGGTWTATTSGLAPTGALTAELTAVSCASATSCVAVGDESPSSLNGAPGQPDVGGDQLGFAEVLSGGTWAPNTPFTNPNEDPDPTDGNPVNDTPITTLSGLSCQSSGGTITTCTAVGGNTVSENAVYDQHGNLLSGSVVQQPVAYATSQPSGSWTQEEIPLSGGASGNPIPATLASVSCLSAQDCVAVGEMAQAAGAQTSPEPLIETLGASGWTMTPAPAPSGAVTASLSSVSCASDGACLAVGDSSAPTGGTAPLVEDLAVGASGWTATTLAQPESGSASSTLVGVDCTADGSCAAAGSYDDTTNGTLPFVDTLAAGTWAPTVGLAPGGGTTTSPSFSAMSCPDAADCVAVGNADSTAPVTNPSDVGLQPFYATEAPAPATQLEVVAPATATVGQPVEITVEALDASGQLASGYTGPVTLTSTDGAAQLPAQVTLDGGAAQVAVTFETPGDQTVTATDASGATPPIAPGTSGTVLVEAPVTGLRVSAPPTATAGSAVTVTVSAVDAAGQVVTGFSDTVTLRSTDPKGVVSPPSEAFRNGVGTYTVTFGTPGPQTLTARDTTNASLSGTATVQVSPRPAAPSPPRNLVAARGGAGVTLRWSPPATDNGSAVTRYLVYRGTTAGGESPVPLGSTTATSFTDTSALADTTYFYVVRAVNAVGTSAPSNEASVVAVVATGGSQAGGHLFAASSVGSGYWVARANGGVYPFAGAGSYGSLLGLHLNAPIVSMAATPDGRGYWLVASDGGIFEFGDAGFFGSLGNIHLNQPIVGMAATPNGRGYWLVASDGGIFDFGDAGFYGSTGNVHLNQPIVGMAPTHDGGGYVLVASDGGLFDFGDATFYGSLGNVHLNQPIVGLALTSDGRGYWMVASDGGIFDFGDARFYGSLGGSIILWPILGMISAPDGAGYRIVNYVGTAVQFGS